MVDDGIERIAVGLEIAGHEPGRRERRKSPVLAIGVEIVGRSADPRGRDCEGPVGPGGGAVRRDAHGEVDDRGRCAILRGARALAPRRAGGRRPIAASCGKRPVRAAPRRRRAPRQRLGGGTPPANRASRRRFPVAPSRRRGPRRGHGGKAPGRASRRSARNQRRRRHPRAVWKMRKRIEKRLRLQGGDAAIVDELGGSDILGGNESIAHAWQSLAPCRSLCRADLGTHGSTERRGLRAPAPPGTGRAAD